MTSKKRELKTAMTSGEFSKETEAEAKKRVVWREIGAIDHHHPTKRDGDKMRRRRRRAEQSHKKCISRERDE